MRSLESFTGNRRRFEIHLQGPLIIDERVVDVMLIDDYAHHPTAIAATLEAARQRYPGQRIVAVISHICTAGPKRFLHSFWNPLMRQMS